MFMVECFYSNFTSQFFAKYYIIYIMHKLPIIALVGQTNAGKSSLFNRLAQKNIAIVAREPGTTRDNVTTTIDNRFILIDTAGLKTPEDTFETSIQNQITDAILSADLIFLTLDASKYPSHQDKTIAKKALKSQKPVFLLLNKSDLRTTLPINEFKFLGIKPAQTFYVSATTGKGINDLKKQLLAILPPPSITHPKTSTDSFILALIGRPNVGKSSLFNTLAHKQQALVSSKQGTTRDINRVKIRYKGKNLEILDTAGLRRPGKREVGIEKFSAIRTLTAIEESDVSALLIDATDPTTKLDQALAGQIINAGKGIILVLTKTDLLSDPNSVLDQLEHHFKFIPYAPVLLTSSQTGINVTKLFELTLQISQTLRQEIKTSELNKILNTAILEHPPAGLKNTKPKPKYITQTDTCPPWFVVHGHELELLHWSWKRFLERKIRERYPFIGTPIMLSYRND